MRQCRGLRVRAVWAGKNITFKTTLKGVGARLQQSAIGDLWMPLISFVALLATLCIGLQRLIHGPTVITTLAISVVWIVYAMIPSYLLLHYTFIGRGTTLVYICRHATPFPSPPVPSPSLPLPPLPFPPLFGYPRGPHEVWSPRVLYSPPLLSCSALVGLEERRYTFSPVGTCLVAYGPPNPIGATRRVTSELLWLWHGRGRPELRRIAPCRVAWLRLLRPAMR